MQSFARPIECELGVYEELAKDLAHRLKLGSSSQRGVIVKEWFSEVRLEYDKETADFAFVLFSIAEGKSEDRNMPPWWVTYSTGLIFAGFLGAVFFVPNLTSVQIMILRFFMALCAGLFFAFFSGRLAIEGKIPVEGFNEHPIAVSAAGGAAAFVLVLFFLKP